MTSMSLTPGPLSLSGERETQGRKGVAGLHRAALRRGRQHGVQPEVIRFLAVVVRPIADRDENRGCARKGIGAEELDGLAQLRVVQLGKRLLAKLEGVFQASDELLLVQRAIRGAALRRRHAGDFAAQEI